MYVCWYIANAIDLRPEEISAQRQQAKLPYLFSWTSAMYGFNVDAHRAIPSDSNPDSTISRIRIGRQFDHFYAIVVVSASHAVAKYRKFLPAKDI